MFEILDLVTHGIGGAFAGRDPSAPTADQPQMCTPEDAGPTGNQTIADFGRGLAQEGLSGLLDPMGMLDRVDAQRDLAERFQVVPDDYAGPRLPNTVTQSEYQGIAHTYSDIRLGRGDLTIDAGHADSDTGGVLDATRQATYRQGALDDIAALMQTASGRAEIEQLHNNAPQGTHQHTTIVPLLNADNTYDTTNGYAEPQGNGSSLDENGARGAGTDVHIRINPGVNIWNNDPQNATNPWAEQTRSDVLLAHEMGHAIQQTAGTQDDTPVQATDTAVSDLFAGRWGDAWNHFWSPSEGMRIDAADGTSRAEHQATGIGLYQDLPYSENAYRRERRAIADGGGPGIIEGRPGKGESDRTMVERDTYVGRPAPPAGP